MFRYKIVLLMLALMFFAERAYALSLTAKVDRTEATVGDRILLTLSVEGTQKAGKPHLPPVPAIDFVSRGSSTRMQIINGQITSSVDYNFLLIPQKAGTFEIGPATLRVKGKTVLSNPITLRISSAGVTPRSKKDLFITTTVSPSSPYVSEQVIYTFRLYRSIRIANASLENPSFEGFLVEPLGKERQYETVINGKTFLVSEIKQALFPTREGTLTIDPARVQCEVVTQARRRRGFFDDPFFDDSFFGLSRTEPRVLQADPIVVKVKPLPAEGKPPLFSGLVGDFGIATDLSKEQLPAGDTTTLTITIQGKGNIRDARSPEFPSSPHFKVYDDKPSLAVKNSGDEFGGVLTVKKALVPLKEGTLTIPALSFTFFNPESERYEVSKSAPLTVQVSPPKDKEQLHLVEAMGTTTSKEEIKILGKDILPIKTSLSSLQPYSLDIWHWGYMVFFFLPIAGYTGCALMKRRKDRLEEDRGYSRSKRAMKQFNRNISAAKKEINNEDSAEFYRMSAKAIKDFLGDKLNLTGSALTPVEIEKQLSMFKVKKEQIEQLKRVLGILESGQFALQRHRQEEREDLLNQIKHLIRGFESRIKR